MDWFTLMCLIWRVACVFAKVVNVFRAVAWMFDFWNDDQRS